MNKINSIVAVALLAMTLIACKKDNKEPDIVVPVSDGSTLTLNGIAASEAGSSAANSVYIDLSADKPTGILRSLWTLGFYAGSDYKVILNANNGVSAAVVNKIDLNAVTAADLVQAKLVVELGVAAESEFDKVDDPRQNNALGRTAIGTISATDTENKVYLINPAGGSHTTIFSADNVYKVRILRKGTGYTLQYAKLNAITYSSLDITKDSKFNYAFVSLADNKVVSVEPEKASWDIVWTWSLYYGGTTGSQYLYGFSDLVFTNTLGGASSAEVLTATKSYANFSESDLSNVNFSAKSNLIGENWRVTTGTGIKADRFYLIKDAAGNVYKLKFVSMGVGSDGGTRGKPVIEYKLVKKG
ncbi:HmuY family protein [Pedobacter sp. ASV28]|uniref:HmuY family protein n=1 Tax=Pedobacter sp. ASV28 TaxID=2795123 RepID=UPI0018ECEC7C|nr:HmuY family protein [Pedobacter sp. ASV28]